MDIRHDHQIANFETNSVCTLFHRICSYKIFMCIIIQFMCECCNVDLPNKMCAVTQLASQKHPSMFSVLLFIIKPVISIHVLYIQAMGKSLHEKKSLVQDFVFPFSSSMCTFSILNIILWALSPVSKVGSLAWLWQHTGTILKYFERLHSL